MNSLEQNPVMIQADKLRAEMNAAGLALKKVARRNQLAAFKSPEYKAHQTAYRAYWSHIDINKIDYNHSIQ